MLAAGMGLVDADINSPKRKVRENEKKKFLEESHEFIRGSCSSPVAWRGEWCCHDGIHRCWSADRCRLRCCSILLWPPAVVAVGVFGNMTSGMFATLTGYLTNQKETSDARLTTVQGDATAGAATANQHVQTVNQQNAAVAGAGTW